ncbi:polysaccharide deacetylase family protein [Falsiroseomonas sp.]|uniref:polysaccharide deacetylase family protein n=1 Tax=Falsiroseomonas sp. TaxID=2870721 RepID=UPI003561C8DA
MQEISVVITMDCEPSTATSHPKATGPRDWAMGERAVTGYVGIAREYGFPCTFFVHPETITAQAAMFRSLEADGHCVGLHMHPWKYAFSRYQGAKYRCHFGDLTEQEGTALLAEASVLFHEAMGRHPSWFRPGTFSANDSTFRVLAALGFRGGSISAPERVYRATRSVWTGCEPDPHRANATFRQLAGELEFGNMPLSADFSQVLTAPNGRRMPADFRPDTDWKGQFGITYRSIAENIVDQVKARAPAVPVLNAISHNMFEFRDAADPFTQRFREMLDEMCAACARAGLKPVGTTLADIVERALQVRPPEEEFAYI